LAAGALVPRRGDEGLRDEALDLRRIATLGPAMGID
jgi:hypothetical protein